MPFRGRSNASCEAPGAIAPAAGRASHLFDMLFVLLSALGMSLCALDTRPRRLTKDGQSRPILGGPNNKLLSFTKVALLSSRLNFARKTF